MRGLLYLGGILPLVPGMTPEEIRETAMLAYSAGLCVIPPHEDGSKRPDGSWKQYQRTRPGNTLMESWYAPPGRAGVGLITGAVSGNLECFEFDDNGSAIEPLKALAAAAGLTDLLARIEGGYSERTPARGTHWFYRCETIEGNKKLASRPKEDSERTHPKDHVQVQIETRGEGGFVIVAPSYGPIHPSGRPYVALTGSLATIAVITVEERAELHRLARTLDQLAPKVVELPSRTEEQSGKPGQDYNARVTWEDVLLPHGWERAYRAGSTTAWRRPGKRDGISATTNHGGSDLLYVFSSSTDFEPERGYSKFSAYALLAHGGDFSAAAKRLASEGYGLPVAGATAYPEDEAAKILAFPRNDAGNGELFAHLYGDRVRYDWQRARWLTWRGHRWQEDPNGELFRLAKHAARVRWTAAAAAEPGERKAVASWVNASQSEPRLNALLARARSEEPITDDGRGWDAHPMLLGVQNGVVDLSTGVLLPGHPHQRITMTTGILYNPVASAPRWMQFLDEVFLGDANTIQFVQRAVGYSLTGSIKERVWFLLIGDGFNGKSKFIDAITAAMGGSELDSYATDVPRKTLSVSSREDIPADIARLVAKRIVTCSEADNVLSLDAGRIKSITGGDVQSARFMHKDFFTFRPVLKFWLTANSLPRVTDTSDAFWDRVRPIWFNAKFELGKNRDDTVGEQLVAELPGILAWAVAGAVAWARDGLQAPQAVLAAVTRYRNTTDPLAEWKTECCIFGDDQWVARSALWLSYTAWADKNHLDRRDRCGRNTFFETLTKAGYKDSRTSSVRRLLGLRLRYDNETGPAPDNLNVDNSHCPEASESENDGVTKRPPPYEKTVHSEKGLKSDFANDGLKPSSVIPACPCFGRHEEGDEVCPGAAEWEDPEGGTHCSACHIQGGIL